VTVTVDFIFDFGSPNAYYSHQVIPEIEKRTGAKFNYIPALLGGIHKITGNQPPMIAFGGIKGKLEYEQLESQRFAKKHGITKFQFNPHFPVITLLIMRGLIAAEMEGKKDAYIEVVLKAMWEDQKKMDDPEVFVQVLNDAGLDGDHFLARTQDPEVKQKLIENTEAAANRGVFGIPSFFVGDEHFFGKDRLGQVEEEIIAQSK
jgi:2-hydroxychromene-2-carboxylate isomerase